MPLLYVLKKPMPSAKTFPNQLETLLGPAVEALTQWKDPLIQILSTLHEYPSDAGSELADDLPDSEYKEYFGPDYKLHACSHNDVENLNSPQYLESIRNQVLQNLSRQASPTRKFSSTSDI